MDGRYSEAIGLSEGDHRLVILLSRSELCGEFCRRQVLVVTRISRVIELPEKGGQRLRVAQWQANRQVQPPVARQPA